MDKMQLQHDEFNSLTELEKAHKNLQLTPIVDDDYPEYRHYYESALRRFIDAIKANGRL